MYSYTYVQIKFITYIHNYWQVKARHIEKLKGFEPTALKQLR
jgi:hypothetical protein